MVAETQFDPLAPRMLDEISWMPRLDGRVFYETA